MRALVRANVSTYEEVEIDVEIDTDKMDKNDPDYIAELHKKLIAAVDKDKLSFGVDDMVVMGYPG